MDKITHKNPSAYRNSMHGFTHMYEDSIYGIKYTIKNNIQNFFLKVLIV